MTADAHDALDVVTAVDSSGVARIRLVGELDWETADDLTAAALACLSAQPPPRRLHLDCAGLTLCDSLGLAALLTIYRRAQETGTGLYLDNRPALLDRVLELTCTAYLFAGPGEADAQGHGTAEQAAGTPPPGP
ncbi:STAS domain-containing protein [Streptomyces sp. enrichment culture]|uniref:STAS domain-containing protein n=1 Tax=Streptomyces sp. enrichment culture TaxID=1795815 RepID=UPI003F561649